MFGLNRIMFMAVLFTWVMVDIASAARPLYVIARRTYDIHKIEAALKKSANALECDVRCGRGQWWVDHDKTGGKSTKLKPWLKAANRAAKKYG